MLKIGITGGIGSGKTTITNVFALMGYPIYIADIESKKITNTSPIIKEKLIALFGPDLYHGDLLNKSLLASYIFSDDNALNKVNAIIHPEVEKDFYSWIDRNKDHKILIIESAILFESGFNHLVDKVITVYTSLEERIKRTMKRDNISKEEVIKRINKQMSDEKKIELSDFTIVNDNRHSVIRQVSDILKQLNTPE